MPTADLVDAATAVQMDDSEADVPFAGDKVDDVENFWLPRMFIVKLFICIGFCSIEIEKYVQNN